MSSLSNNFFNSNPNHYDPGCLTKMMCNGTVSVKGLTDIAEKIETAVEQLSRVNGTPVFQLTDEKRNALGNCMDEIFFDSQKLIKEETSLGECFKLAIANLKKISDHLFKLIYNDFNQKSNKLEFAVGLFPIDAEKKVITQQAVTLLSRLENYWKCEEKKSDLERELESTNHTLTDKIKELKRWENIRDSFKRLTDQTEELETCKNARHACDTSYRNATSVAEAKQKKLENCEKKKSSLKSDLASTNTTLTDKTKELNTCNTTKNELERRVNETSQAFMSCKEVSQNTTQLLNDVRGRWQKERWIMFPLVSAVLFFSAIIGWCVCYTTGKRRSKLKVGQQEEEIRFSNKKSPKGKIIPLAQKKRQSGTSSTPGQNRVSLKLKTLARPLPQVPLS